MILDSGLLFWSTLYNMKLKIRPKTEIWSKKKLLSTYDLRNPGIRLYTAHILCICLISNIRNQLSTLKKHIYATTEHWRTFRTATQNLIQSRLPLTNDNNTGSCSDIPSQENTAVLSSIAPISCLNLQSKIPELAVFRSRGNKGVDTAGVYLLTSQLSRKVGAPLKVASVLFIYSTGELYCWARQNNGILRRWCNFNSINDWKQEQQN